ncbi:hypothetical protein BABINDRAFT_171260 [Babjeviella inositovora NRRL Y-12698]|uniref:Protein YIP n=1 Tax=Babjeviella inositovora NRRL Y-12698 TaxID=984486 RepID=A0A1E3QRM3_9ASCO|nr:uncharacterized protein BABINDRAFT_171260 [Babjeviella inositovora NRRL Y-12698]ODQ80310.1 hypothetical protein BABINDRAFT_171260 [Babjeviella inositovora NRRL Y-12698]
MSGKYDRIIDADDGGHFFSINYYRQYFDIDSNEFLAKCMHAMIPFTRIFGGNEAVDTTGELYGAIWCTATIIVLLFLSNTGSNMLTNWVKHSDIKYQYDFALLTKSISLLYGYILVVPIVAYSLARWYFKFPQSLTLVQYVSIYGYSNIPWIPASVLGLVGGLLGNHSFLSSLLRWICIGIGGVLSLLNIVLGIYPNVKKNFAELGKEKVALVELAVLSVVHVGFTIAVKISFFGVLN